MNDEQPFILPFPQLLQTSEKSDNENFISAVLHYFGSAPATTAADFLARADELDTVADLVGRLRKYHGDTVANFAMGFYGGGGELPETKKKIF